MTRLALLVATDPGPEPPDIVRSPHVPHRAYEDL